MDSTMLAVAIVISTLFQGCLAGCRYYNYYSYGYYCYYMTGGSIAGVVIGCIIGIAILVALTVACCVKGCCSTPSPGVVITQQPQAMTVAHISTSQTNQGYVHGYPQGYAQSPPPYSAGPSYPAVYPPGQQMQHQPPYMASPPKQSSHTPARQMYQDNTDTSYLQQVAISAPGQEPGYDDRTYERLNVQN